MKIIKITILFLTVKISSKKIPMIKKTEKSVKNS